MYDIIASIVTFKNDKDVLKKAIDSFLETNLKVYLYVIDNSPTNKLKDVCVRRNVEYIFSNKNLGFGAGHNIAIRKMAGRTRYTLILNPDVYFNKGTIEKLFSFMEENKEVGFVMPKVLYPDGSLQYLCRLLPNPYDILIRKINFRFLNPLINSRKIRNELRLFDYNKPMDVPYLSGCFMFIKTEAFERIGIFDERFFIYFEDVDLARRIHKLYRTVYYPEAIIYHNYERGSDKDLVLLKQLIFSGIKYFNKWGWFFDRKRHAINTKTIDALKEYSGNIKLQQPARKHPSKS
jgi:hypothetical protein